MKVELGVANVADIVAWKDAEGNPVATRDGEVTVLDEGVDTGESGAERRTRTIRSVAALWHGCA